MTMREEPDTATVQLRQRGVLTLPKGMRERHGLSPGDALRVVDLDGVFVLTPLVPMVPALAREIERMRLDAGLTTQELLDRLRAERERYVRELYGDDFLEHDSSRTADENSLSDGA